MIFFNFLKMKPNINIIDLRLLERSLYAAIFTIVKIARYYIIFWWKCGKSTSQIWHCAYVSIQTNKQTKMEISHRMTYIQWLWLQRWRAELSKSRKDHHEWGVGCHLIWAGVIIGTQPHRTCLHVKVMIGRGPWELRKPPGFNTT